jgi:hypothetical protein
LLQSTAPRQSTSQLAPGPHFTSHCAAPPQFTAHVLFMSHVVRQRSALLQSTPHSAPALQRTSQSVAPLHSKLQRLSRPQLVSHASAPSHSTSQPHASGHCGMHAAPGAHTVAVQRPSAVHTSPLVHSRPSSQLMPARCGTRRQESDGSSQLPRLQASLTPEQSVSAPPVHSPPLHASPVVQNSPSSHAI